MNEQDREPSAPLIPRQIYYGWWIVLAGFLLILIATALQGDTRFILELELARLEGFSRTFSVYLYGGLIVVLAPVVGHLVDRFPVPAIVVPVLVALPLLLVLATFSSQIWSLYLAWIVILAVLPGVLHITFAKAATAWFKRHLGIVYGLLFAALSLAQLVADVSGSGLIQRFTWPFTVDLERGAPLSPDLALALPMLGVLLFFLLRSQAFVLDAWLPLHSILLHRSYLALLAACVCQASAVLLLHLAVNGLSWSYFPLFSPLRLAAVPFSETPLGVVLPGVAALLLTGVLADRFGGRRVALGTIVAQAACVVIVAIDVEGWNVVAFSVAAGTGVGTLCVPIVLLLTEYYGRRHFGLMLGALTGGTLCGYILMTSLIHFMFEESSLNWPPFLAVFLLAIALLLIFLMKRPQHQNAPAESAPQAVS